MNPNNFSPPGSGIIWFGLPKTASSSQKKAVALTFGLLSEEEIKTSGGMPLKTVNKRLDIYSLAAVHGIQCADPAILSFVTVRNPYDRFVSLWNERVRGRPRGTVKRGLPGGLTLEKFSEWLFERPDDRDVDHHCHRQVTKTVLNGILVPKVILRFEELADDWTICQRVVRQRHGLELPELEHLRNGRRHNHYREVYTDRARRLIEQRYVEDLERFGYDF